jgi:hypothetical protein
MTLMRWRRDLETPFVVVGGEPVWHCVLSEMMSEEV